MEVRKGLLAEVRIPEQGFLRSNRSFPGRNSERVIGREDKRKQ